MKINTCVYRRGNLGRGEYKKANTISGILVAVISIILVLISGFIYSSIKGAQEKEAQKYLKEIVSQYKNMITTQMQGDIQTLDALATFIGQSDAIDLDFTLSRLEAESSRNDFIRMGFVASDHTGYFIDRNGEKYYDIEIGDETFVHEALSGEAVVSEVMKDKLSEESIVCYGVPVTYEGKIIGALTGTRSASIFAEIISQEIFDGAAYVHVIDQEGNFIIRSEHAVIDKQMNNIFDEGEVTQEIQSSFAAFASVFQRNMEEGERYYRDNADHFGMLLHFHGKDELITRIQKIQTEINDYTLSPNQDYRVNCNFGIYVIQPEANKNLSLLPDAVLNGALLALNSVNGNTANPIAFYDKAIHDKARKKVEIESRMHAALENKEFHMYLQPKYFLDDQSLHSAEALVRWCTEDGTIHYPDEFIPVFEENGFITELDMFMLEEACRRVSCWILQGYDVRPISVNQSRIFFYDEDYLDKFHEIVDKYDIDPSMIILEVTESVAMSNLERVKMVIKKLHKMGFSISMDDFGSGYSSLNTLKDLDIAELKLDKEFLTEQSTSPRGKVVIGSVIHLARALSITTVAEGIENQVQLEFLKGIQCDIGQGFYFAKPMPVDEFENSVLRNPDRPHREPGYWRIHS